MTQPKGKRRKENGPSVANALIIYGVIPVILFIAYSFIDERTFGLLTNLRVETDLSNISDQVKARASKSHQVPLGNKAAAPLVVEPTAEHQEIVEIKPPRRKAQTKETQQREPHNPQTNTILVDTHIGELRDEYHQDPNDFYRALRLAETLLQRDLQHHDGGTVQSEAIQIFVGAIGLIEKKRDDLLHQGTDVRLNSGRQMSINDEMMLGNEEKSLQGLLVGAYCSLSSQYFMANMFEKTVQAAGAALELEPDCLDALNSRASSLVILGKYNDAGSDYSKILEIDSDHDMIGVFSGVVKVLKAKEDSIPNGWAKLLDVMTPLISFYEQKLPTLDEGNTQMRQIRMALMVRLKTMHFAMFAYHESKSGDNELAWHHLTLASRYKMAVLPPYNAAREDQNIAVIKSIFVHGFWPSGVGSTSRKPIFIVGFPRSGSTLLERILDAHPQIVGTGEDSVFNGILGEVRDGIIQASATGSLVSVVQAFANRIDSITRERWAELERNSNGEESSSIEPRYFVDKMLSNYKNIGFIHMLYPDALILHIAREPMDTVFSSFKHEFPPGKLDYTSDMESLAHMYRNYREIMDHWDEHLPGRVTHIRYEDIVHDKTGMSKSIIAATGLDWDDDILNFHKKKQAVNTHSTTQVRKGIYNDSLQTWKRHESHLQPLVHFLGKSNTKHKFETSLPGYHITGQSEYD